MKENKITILGKEYPLVYSAHAQEKIRDYFAAKGDVDEQGIGIGDVDAMLDILMSAGRLYYKITERDYPEPLPCNPSDVCDTEEMVAFITAITDTLASGKEREVETVDGKNTETTQDKK